MLLCRELTVQKLFRVANELYVNVRKRDPSRQSKQGVQS